jgi:hypothetical protein
MKAQPEEQRRVVQQQQELLQQAAVAVNQQLEEIGALRKTVMSPQGRNRWGLFAEATSDDFEMGQPSNESHAAQGAMLARGNIPVPPQYKECTKREKREFMDKYLSYERRMQAISETAGRLIALNPVGASIEHKTLIRICMFEVKKSADQMTEQDWKSYLLAAKKTNEADYAYVEAAMRSLHMDVSLKDADRES